VVWVGLWYARLTHHLTSELAVGAWALAYLCAAIVVLGTAFPFLVSIPGAPARERANAGHLHGGAAWGRSGRPSGVPMVVGLVVAVGMLVSAWIVR
jgi:hypothetical protein